MERSKLITRIWRRFDCTCSALSRESHLFMTSRLHGIVGPYRHLKFQLWQDYWKSCHIKKSCILASHEKLHLSFTRAVVALGWNSPRSGRSLNPATSKEVQSKLALTQLTINCDETFSHLHHFDPTWANSTLILSRLFLSIICQAIRRRTSASVKNGKWQKRLFMSLSCDLMIQSHDPSPMKSSDSLYVLHCRMRPASLCIINSRISDSTVIAEPN